MLSTSEDTHLGGDDFDKVSNISTPLEFLLCYRTIYVCAMNRARPLATLTYVHRNRPNKGN